MYQPKTGAKCGCKRGVARDNCPACEGTGWVIDFRTIRDSRIKNKKKGNDNIVQEK
jgi:hypothetical protein